MSVLISDDLRFIGATLEIIFTLLVVSVQYAQDLLRWVFIMYAGNAETWLTHQIRVDFRAVIVKKLKFWFFHIFFEIFKANFFHSNFNA